MKDIGIGSRDAKPCAITAIEEGGWDAPGASVFKKDGRHVYIYDPDGGLPESARAFVMAMRSGQRTFTFTLEAEEAVRMDGASIALCRVLSGAPAAMKYLGRMKESAVMTGDIRDMLRGKEGCGVML